MLSSPSPAARRRLEQSQLTYFCKKSNENRKGYFIHTGFTDILSTLLMKSIRRILIAILLGLLLALGSWQVVHAPHYEQASIPDKAQGVTVESKSTPRPVVNTQFVGRVTAVPEKPDIPLRAGNAMSVPGQAAFANSQYTFAGAIPD